MSSPELAPAREPSWIRPGRGRVALEARGMRLPRAWFWPASAFVPYEGVTHLQLGARSLRIGTRRGVFAIRRAHFAERRGPEALVRALLERIADEPGGPSLLARMAEVEETARHAAPLRAAVAAAAACLAVLGLEIGLGPVVAHAGLFSAPLVRAGETWRVATANLLHGSLPHLALNVLGLVVLGGLVERPLGALRTTFILGVAALGASAAGLAAGYAALVGASGMVAGLAGAIVWLEFRHPERLPASWRVPRRPLLAALAADALLPLALPFVAGAAHVGGFAAGATAAALAAGPGLRREPLRRGVSVGAALVAAVALAALGGAARLVVGAPAAWEEHADRLLSTEEAPPLLLNDAAWLIATAPQPTPKALLGAVELAERAVEATGRRDPNVLDTLAEAQFRLGMPERAVATIGEAIALAPGEPYFEEQRRRFTGERAFDDRPAPPAFLPLPAEPRSEPPPVAPDRAPRRPTEAPAGGIEV